MRDDDAVRSTAHYQPSIKRVLVPLLNYAQTWGSTGYCLPVALLSLKPGYHFINVEAWDALGNISLTGSILQVVP